MLLSMTFQFLQMNSIPYVVSTKSSILEKKNFWKTTKNTKLTSIMLSQLSVSSFKKSILERCSKMTLEKSFFNQNFQKFRSLKSWKNRCKSKYKRKIKLLKTHRRKLKRKLRFSRHKMKPQEIKMKILTNI
jgi:hypothetical protein